MQKKSASFHLLMGCSTSSVEANNTYTRLNTTTTTSSRSRSSSSSSRSRSNSLVRDVPKGCLADVPKGCLAVYVGDERQRYVIRAHLLNHPAFRLLLDKSANEFGFEHRGGLTLACPSRDFEQLLWLVKKGDNAVLNLKLAELS